MSILSAAGTTSYDPSLTSANLPPINQALEPADIRNGNTQAKQAYQEALGFEDILMQQMTQELASTGGSLNFTVSQAEGFLGTGLAIASGDTGAQSKLFDGLAHVQYPGSDPWVLAAGGTTIGVA